jgi:arginine deiminase
VLIAGIARDTASGELPKFDIYPIPNLFFMRDPQIVIGDRVVVSSMATQARRRESLLSKYVFENHPHFRREEQFWVDFMESEPERPMPRNMPTIEGGDVLVPRRDLILVGVTERTNKAGVEALLTSLRVAKAGVKTAIIVDIPRQRSFMHLDTIFTFINRHECLIYPPVILPSGSEAAKVSSVDLTKKRGLDYKSEKSLLDALKKCDFDLEPIYCGGDSAIDQQRERKRIRAGHHPAVRAQRTHCRSARKTRLSHRLRRRSAPRANRARNVDRQEVRAADCRKRAFARAWRSSLHDDAARTRGALSGGQRIKTGRRGVRR